MTVVVHDLGTLLISHNDQRVSPGGKKPSALLAALVIEVNRRVSVETLMFAAWGEHATASPSTLESHIFRLRRVLEPDRLSGQAPVVLVNDAGGYRLLLGQDQLDSTRFQQLTDDARDLLAARDPARALDRLDAAAELWRGQPYSPMSDEEWTRTAVARWLEIHDQVAERRIDVLLALGRTEQALADLGPLLTSMPYRERLWGQRMLGLYRSGRGEEALQTFHTARRVLIDEIGLEPGVELQTLQRGILDQDPRLMIATDSESTVAPPPTGVHLPPRTAPLIGRVDELAAMVPLVQARRLVTVVGAAGCGKTRLGIEVARQAATAFPDGVWFIDLAPTGDAELITDLLMTTLGMAAAAGGSSAEALQSFVRDRRILLLLDNCEHLATGVAELVSSWLDGEGEGAVLATSREPLAVDGEVLWSLSPLPIPADSGYEDAANSPAVQLFVARLLEADPTYVVDADALTDIEAICVAVDGLPLAIELAAARARTYSLAEIAAQVTEDPSDLARVNGRGPNSRTSVRSTIESSYRLLSPPEQQLHQMLSVLPGSFTRSAATGFLSLSADAVGDVLPLLVNRSLLTAVRSPRSAGPTTFRQLATVRGHARAALADTGRTIELLDARDRWLFDLGEARPRLGRIEILPWYQAIDDDYVTVRGVLQRSLLENGEPAAAHFAGKLTMYWYYRDQLVEGSRLLHRAVEIADRLDPFDAVVSRLGLAAIHAFHGRSDLARPHLDRALADVDRVPQSHWPILGDHLVAISAGAGLGDADLADRTVARASELARATGDLNLDILVRAQTLRATMPMRDALDPVATAEQAEQTYAEAIEVGHLLAAWISCAARCLTAAQLRQPDEGLLWSHRLLSIHQRFGSRRGGPIVEIRANFTAMSRRPGDAVTLFSASHTNARRAGTQWPRLPISAQLFDACRRALSQSDFDRAWHDGASLDLNAILVNAPA
ncbi:MAG: AfsR/SARP family transcriptional regulator [Pseudonocardiales bacterium]|nr:AfsR/SARP family transcriptional regulator [Pseudonocardiales bacterium]